MPDVWNWPYVNNLCPVRYRVGLGSARPTNLFVVKEHIPHMAMVESTVPKSHDTVSTCFSQ